MAFVAPHIDYHGLAPELLLAGVLALVLVVDLVWEERARRWLPTLSGIGLLVALVPVLTLARDGADRVLFGGAYAVDDFSLVAKALFLLAGYVIVLLSTDYVGEGDFYEGEYYVLLLSSLLGMVVMASARDLLSIFVALELLSIPAYLLAGWAKRDLRGNEASLKYYLLGVFSAAVMLYGMSLIFGVVGSTVLADIASALGSSEAPSALVVVGIVFVLVGFAFKISAVPFHAWAPDTYQGAPTPITAFLSVASKAAGFVAILSLVFVAFPDRSDVWGPMFWVLAALTMTVGNLIALRQTNVIRLLAYSSVAQAGFMLVPLAVAGDLSSSGDAIGAVVTYLLVYAVMNLGAFGVVLAVARKTRSGEIASFGGLFEYSPGLTVAMTGFLFSLAGIPPLGGWYAKFLVFRSVADAGTPWAIVLGVVVAVNSVIALYYYAGIAREMWMRPVPDGDRSAVPITASLVTAVALCAAGTLVAGVLPNLLGHLGQVATFSAG